MRIGIIALLQESNTFIGQPTTLAHFEQELLATGESVRERLAGTHHEVAGMFHALHEAGEDAAEDVGIEVAGCDALLNHQTRIIA